MIKVWPASQPVYNIALLATHESSTHWIDYYIYSGGTYSRMQLFEMLGGIDPIELVGVGGETVDKKCVFQGSDDFHLKDRYWIGKLQLLLQLVIG